MLRYLAQFRADWHAGSLTKAQAQAERYRAAFVGVTVPPGSAYIRPAGLSVTMDVIPSAANVTSGPSAPLVESAAPSVDIVTAMQHPGRAYAVWGPQQSGKSWVARHALASAAARGNRCVVIGPKLPAGEWGVSCELYGPRWDDVVAGLRMISQLAQDRREESTSLGVPTQSYAPVYVVIDDWTETVSRLGREAEQLLTSATTMFASCNVLPIFILHANTTASWGNAIGKCLTENFLRVRVLAGDSGGIPSPASSRYAVLMPGEEERTIAKQLTFPRFGFLPGGPPAWHTAYRAPGTPDYGANPRPEPVCNAGMHERYVNARVHELPPAPPQRIRVRTERGKWHVALVPMETASRCRRIYETERSLAAVVRTLKITGSKQTKLALAQALLGLPSLNYQIL